MKFGIFWKIALAAAMTGAILFVGLVFAGDFAGVFGGEEGSRSSAAVRIEGQVLSDLSEGTNLFPDEYFPDNSFLSPDLFESNIIVSYYGHPNSRMMGILGRYPIEKLAEKLKATAAQYDATNGEKGVVPAFYLIYGTCQPGGNIGIMDKWLAEKYIEYGATNGILVFLDHQIGRFSVESAMNKLLPFLKYPNVHLALDPEWRTTRPMEVIGTVTAGEINRAQKMMQEYMLTNRIPGKRILVIHQFNYQMIQYRHRVRSDYDPVLLVHTTDGFGPPSLKLGTYAMNAQATNMPVKGFKLFYYSGYRGAGFDDPLMTPAQVLRLKPQPLLIIYQ